MFQYIQGIHPIPAFPIRMHILHILQFDWFPENSTEYQLGNYRHYKHSFFKEREMLRYRSNWQIIQNRIISFIVLSSDNTNCKNDIQLFHQLFDELSVYRDYH